MKWVIYNDETAPPIDNSDYPTEYIVRGHCDGWRGNYDLMKLTAEKLRDVKGYDWMVYLDESEDYEKVLIELQDRVKELDKALATAVIFITQPKIK